jgi:taurine dehydrogenase small subunit
MSQIITVGLVQEIVAAFNKRDVELIMSHFADDCTFLASRGDSVVGERIHGKEAVRKYLADRFVAIPDMRWEPVRDEVYGNHAVSVWIVKGKTPNGETLESQGCDLWEFRDGKVLNKDTYWKIRHSK